MVVLTEDIDRLDPNAVVGISGDALHYLQERFPNEYRREEELKTLLSLVGITEPYEHWDENNSKTACFRNEGEDDGKPIQMLPVRSSNLRAIGYDRKRSILEVSFLNGSTYRYFDVPEYLYDGIMSANSHGKYLDAHIKQGSFRYQQV